MGWAVTHLIACFLSWTHRLLWRARLEMRPGGAVDTRTGPASPSHLTSICELIARPGLWNVGQPGAGLLGSSAVAIALPELERAF